MTASKGEEMKFAVMRKMDEELSLDALKRDVERAITSRIRYAMLKFAQGKYLINNSVSESAISLRTRDVILKLVLQVQLMADHNFRRHG